MDKKEKGCLNYSLISGSFVLGATLGYVGSEALVRKGVPRKMSSIGIAIIGVAGVCVSKRFYDHISKYEKLEAIKGIPAPSNLVFRKLLVEMAGAFCIGVSVGSLGTNIDLRAALEEWNKHRVN